MIGFSFVVSKSNSFIGKLPFMLINRTSWKGIVTKPTSLCNNNIYLNLQNKLRRTKGKNHLPKINSQPKVLYLSQYLILSI